MTKFIVIFAYFGLAIITLTSQNVDAKPFLNPNFFVLTTKAPLNGQGSGFGGGFQLTNLIMPKIRLILNLLQNPRGKKSSLLGGGLFGGSASVTTSTKKPDFDDSFEAEDESTTKYTTTAPITVTKPTSTENNSDVDASKDIDLRIASGTNNKESIEKDVPKNLIKNDDQSKSFNSKNDHSNSHEVSDNDDESSSEKNNNSLSNKNNNVTNLNNNDSAFNAQSSHESDEEDRYLLQLNINTNEIPSKSMKSNKYLPPAP